MAGTASDKFIPNDEVKRDLMYFSEQRIQAYGRGHEEYERSVATPNMLFRYSRPAYVVQPTARKQVQTIIKYLHEQKRSVTIKCGGHSSAGYSTAGPASVSLDLRKMNTAKLSADMESVDIDAGCQWGHVYKTLINDNHDGYFINGGRCPLVGVSGFVLGGGLGPFSRQVGMGCDTLVEATIVDYKGDVFTVNEKHERGTKEGDLFWALRGAGAANFGVLVGMKMRVQALQSGGKQVVAGRYQWFPDRGHDLEFATAMNRFYTADWSRRMTIDSTWICEYKNGKRNIGVRFLVYYDGPKSEFTEEVKQRLGAGKNEFEEYEAVPFLDELTRRVSPEPSTRFLHETLIYQWSEETVKAFPTNRTFSIYTSFCFENTPTNIYEIVKLIQKEMIRFQKKFKFDTTEFLVSFIHSGGKAMEKPDKDTAFYWREATYHAYITLEWEDKWLHNDMTEFMQQTKKKFRQYSLDRRAIYINFPDNAQEKDDYEAAYFGVPNKAGLQQVKLDWDPENFFSWNHGIQLPALESTSQAIEGAGEGLAAAAADAAPAMEEAKEEPEDGVTDNTTFGVQAALGVLKTGYSVDAIALGDWEYYQNKSFKDDVQDLIDLGPDAARYLY